MQKPENWDEVEAFTGEFKNITPGGHVCRIIQAKVEKSNSGNEMLTILFDIAEGDCAGYYTEQFERKLNANPDAKWQGTYRQLTQGNSEKFFKGLLMAIEKSNDGYTWNWDEKTLKGKLFGGVFGQEEYVNTKGEVKLSTKCRFIRSVEQVRKGVEVPEIKRLEHSEPSGAESFGHEVFPEESIPF
jgi:hypothetical protein